MTEPANTADDRFVFESDSASTHFGGEHESIIYENTKDSGFHGTKFKAVDFRKNRNVWFENCKFENCHFKQGYLFKFINCKFDNCSFTNCNHVDFDYKKRCKSKGVIKFTDCLNYLSLENTIIT